MKVCSFARCLFFGMLVAVTYNEKAIAEVAGNPEEMVLEISQLQITDESGKSITLQFSRPIIVDLHDSGRNSLGKIIDFDPGAMIKMDGENPPARDEIDEGVEGQAIDARFSASGTINLVGQLRALSEPQEEAVNNSVCLKVEREEEETLEGGGAPYCADIE